MHSTVGHVTGSHRVVKQKSRSCVFFGDHASLVVGQSIDVGRYRPAMSRSREGRYGRNREVTPPLPD